MDGLQKLTNALSNGTIPNPLRPPLKLQSKMLGKRMLIEDNMYGGLIGTHQRSFEWYHSRPQTASPSQDWGLATPKTTI